MDPNLGVASSVNRPPTCTTNSAVTDMRKLNEELEMELRRRKEREEEMKKELERVLKRVSVAEEAEEMLCAQLEELEDEAAEEAEAYQSRVVSLMEQLAHAHRILNNGST